MIKAGYEQLLERIGKNSGLSREEIERRIDAKRAKLSQLVSKEGAAQIVAAELGVTFDKQTVKISELLQGMRKISTVGKVMQIFPVRTYIRNKKESKVANLIVADETSSVRVVLWDTSQIALIEEGKIVPGSVVDIKDGTVRENELHLGSVSKISLSTEKIDAVQMREAVSQEKMIYELKSNDRAAVRAHIVQIFEPRFFEVCPECAVRLNRDGEKFVCATHGVVIPKLRAVLSLVLDDGTDTIKAVCFSDVLDKLFQIPKEEIDRIKDAEFFIGKREDLLGKEFLFSGRMRQNKMFGNMEFGISDAHEMNAQEILQKLSA